MVEMTVATTVDLMGFSKVVLMADKQTKQDVGNIVNTILQLTWNN